MYLSALLYKNLLLRYAKAILTGAVLRSELKVIFRIYLFYFHIGGIIACHLARR